MKSKRSVDLQLNAKNRKERPFEMQTCSQELCCQTFSPVVIRTLIDPTEFLKLVVNPKTRLYSDMKTLANRKRKKNLENEKT